MLAGSSVEDGIDASIKVGEHVCRGRRADMAEEVGAWGGNGHVRGAQKGLRDRVRRDADADKSTAGCDSIGNGGPSRQQHRERTRAEALEP